MIDSKLYKEFRKEINLIKIFDTHDHIVYETERNSLDIDFFRLFVLNDYLCGDIIGTGLKEEDLNKLTDPLVRLKDKWDIFYPFYQKTKNTMYARAALISLKDIYGIDNLTYESIDIINEKIKENKNPNFYDEILINKANISYILNDHDSLLKIMGLSQNKPDKDYVLPVIRFDDIINIKNRSDLLNLEKKYNTEISSIKDFISFNDVCYE